MALTWWDICIFVLFLLGVGYAYYARKLKKFERKGVKSLPAYPIVGNFGGILTRRKHFFDVITEAYMAFPDQKYMGFFQMQRPFLMIRDLDIIKHITVKDFDHFEDHMSFFDQESEPLFGKTLVTMTGQKWRDMRATLSPAFTSSKMRNMFALVEECAERTSKFYADEIKKSIDSKDTNLLEIELRDTFTRYANDVIATSAFGITIDSLSDKNNEFYTMGKLATTFTFYQFMKIIFTLSVPYLNKILKIRVFDPKITDFFRKLVTDQMNYRESKNLVRPDMIHLLMEAKRGSLKHENETPTADAGFATVQESAIGSRTIKREWSDDELIAQAVLFLFAGFDTVSTMMSFMGTELAMNQDIQKRLQNEIDDLIGRNKKITYNDIQQMKYMDMVVSEVLRLWPPGGLADRKCVKPYTFAPPSPGGKPYTIEVGETVGIPILALHRDPNYFGEPDKFDPERFSDENKSNIKPFTYLPFGAGPRNCIGSRFALMEIKCIAFHMLSKFDFVTVPKTCSPIVLDKTSLALTVKGGFWIGLKLRNCS